jgi:hypothetical protein
MKNILIVLLLTLSAVSSVKSVLKPKLGFSIAVLRLDCGRK